MRLASATVRTPDGERVGRVRDVYLHDADGELAALGVQTGRMRTRQCLLPRGAVTVRWSEGPRPEPDVRLAVPLEVLRDAVEPPDEGHISAEELQKAERALGLTGPE